MGALGVRPTDDRHCAFRGLDSAMQELQELLSRGDRVGSKSQVELDARTQLQRICRAVERFRSTDVSVMHRLPFAGRAYRRQVAINGEAREEWSARFRAEQ